jgi:hypothetical protein
MQLSGAGCDATHHWSAAVAFSDRLHSTGGAVVPLRQRSLLICWVSRWPRATVPVTQQLREVQLLPVRLSRRDVLGARPAATALHGEQARRGSRI